MSKIIVWDSEGLPPTTDEVIILWRDFSNGSRENIISVPYLIEKNADVIKNRYLAWIHDLGEICIEGQRLVDYLQLKPELSYWWMMPLVEKNNYSKSPQIEEAIRLIAFIDWVNKHSIESVTLISNNKQLFTCMSMWFKKININLKWENNPYNHVEISLLRKIYKTLPFQLQALIELSRYIVGNFFLCGVGINEWKRSKGKIVFFSYSTNLNSEYAKAGEYRSYYWNRLPDDLKNSERITNWLHIYIKDNILPNSHQAAKKFKTFNNNKNNKQNHVTLATFLSITVILNAIYDWHKLARKSRIMQKTISKVTSDGLDLWPLFKNEWLQSTIGNIAIKNTLTLNLFIKALEKLPKQEIGVYLQENQSWEFGLIQAWKVTGHKRLIGYPHTTIRFWDLRYFFDRRNYIYERCPSFPAPNFVAVNGNFVKKTLIEGGYPKKNIVEVEALRYLYLGKKTKCPNAVNMKLKKRIRLLVLCDYLLSHTKHQIDILEKAFKHISMDVDITVKPHPASILNIDVYPSLKLSIDTKPIDIIINDYDIIYTSSTTSAAIDAYCIGKPVIIPQNPNTLNLSPLRGLPNVYFITNEENLAKALISAKTSHYYKKLVKNLFFIDSELSRWKKILEIEI